MTRACSPPLGWLQAGSPSRLQTMAEKLLGPTSLVLDLDDAAAILSPGRPGPAAGRHCRPIPGAAPVRSPACAGVCKVPGRRPPGLRAQAAAGCRRGDRPDPRRAGRRGAGSPAVQPPGGNPAATRAAGLGAIEVAGPGITTTSAAGSATGRTSFTSCRSPAATSTPPTAPAAGWARSPPRRPTSSACAAGPTSESIFGQLG